MAELVDALRYAESIKSYSECNEAVLRENLQGAINSGESLLNIRPTPRTPPPEIYVVPCCRGSRK
ncbi:MAG: hypothetical protein F6K23_18665 [Okeania sp. SIO2C9]|uniref:hypothetical protein n=1 Tax=Okeania sp. SIO2C9 TaxID=2607791 RepID=UPI0013C1876E|nr:hypothetical protein [Okeania sp. SIO2C9]NEQ74885.1 hypothetical protein [Okeania sp. SIO2C9]